MLLLIIVSKLADLLQMLKVCLLTLVSKTFLLYIIVVQYVIGSNSRSKYYYYYYTRLTASSITAWISRYQKGKNSLDLNEERDDGALACSGISWTICKQSAPRSREITTPRSHNSIFTGQMLFLTPNQQCQSTEDT